MKKKIIWRWEEDGEWYGKEYEEDKEGEENGEEEEKRRSGKVKKMIRRKEDEEGANIGCSFIDHTMDCKIGLIKIWLIKIWLI